jgi:hypothetical protein
MSCPVKVTDTPHGSEKFVMSPLVPAVVLPTKSGCRAAWRSRAERSPWLIDVADSGSEIEKGRPAPPFVLGDPLPVARAACEPRLLDATVGSAYGEVEHGALGARPESWHRRWSCAAGVAAGRESAPIGARAALIVLLAGCYGTWFWWESRPKPSYVAVAVEQPAPTPLPTEQNPSPSRSEELRAWFCRALKRSLECAVALDELHSVAA